jgi:release factor glutamine methyltransferase
LASDTEVWTVRRLAEWATQDFRTRGIETPRLDAEVLLSDVLHLTRTQLILDYDRELSDAELAILRGLIKRRRSREPLAYLRGHREFYGRDFLVDKRVLVPRPDTEALVDVALRRTAERPLGTRVLDLCTGSGAVAISFAKERRTARVLGTDISNDALAVARANAQKLGAYNVGFVQSDLFDGVPAMMARAKMPARFELITSNPPYIPSADIPTLMADVRDHEPHLALDGGGDGLHLVRIIVQSAPDFLIHGGAMAMEIGAGQAPAVAALFTERGFTDVRSERDLARIERVVHGVWP